MLTPSSLCSPAPSHRKLCRGGEDIERADRLRIVAALRQLGRPRHEKRHAHTAFIRRALGTA